MKPEFEYVTFISAPATEVWAAITDPEVVKEYYMVPLTKLELDPGGVIEYGLPDEVMIRGEVLALVEGESLVHSFAFTDKPEEPASRVEYRVVAMGEMSQLVLVHDGFEPGSATYQDISGGWPVILSQLKTLLESGEKLPWPSP